MKQLFLIELTDNKGKLIKAQSVSCVDPRKTKVYRTFFEFVCNTPNCFMRIRNLYENDMECL